MHNYTINLRHILRLILLVCFYQLQILKIMKLQPNQADSSKKRLKYVESKKKITLFLKRLCKIK